MRLQPSYAQFDNTAPVGGHRHPGISSARVNCCSRPRVPIGLRITQPRVTHWGVFRRTWVPGSQ
jgi:hypothetical protein